MIALKTTTNNQKRLKHLRNVINGSACFNSKSQKDFESLLEKVTDYELELLDYADRLLSDKAIPMDSMTALVRWKCWAMKVLAYSKSWT